MSDPLAKAVAEARCEIRQVKDWLLRPGAQTMCACVPALERAALVLQEAVGHIGTEVPAPESSGTLQQLDWEIRETQALLVAAGRLYIGSVQRLTGAATLESQNEKSAHSFSVVG